MAASFKPCSVIGCNRPHIARGLCTLHYRRWKKHGDPLKLKQVRPPEGAIDRFLAEALATEDKERCLPWPFSKQEDGRGQVGRAIGRNDRRVLAHHFICEKAHGPPPTPKHGAAHWCGNGHLGCVNPYHVRWATQTENKADELIHGTRNRGIRNGQTKLTEQDIRTIRRLRPTTKLKDLADVYGLTMGGISNIASRKRWGWLPD